MTEVATSGGGGGGGGGNAADKLAALQREAESLKVRLEEERQKLNDITREF